MNKAFQENLCKIINEYGHLVYREDKRLEGLLKDLCPQQKKEINLIMSAVKNGSVEEMLNYNNYYPLESLLAKLINKLVNEHGINEILAQKTIHLIAYTLKLLESDTTLPNNESISSNSKKNLVKSISDKLTNESESTIPSYEVTNLFEAISKNDIEFIKDYINPKKTIEKDIAQVSTLS